MTHIVERQVKVTTFSGRVIPVTKYELTFDSGCVWVYGDKDEAYSELSKRLTAQQEQK